MAKTSQKSPIPTTIVSGGQTGVDRAALDVAISLGIPHDGWCPRGRLAEDGRIPADYNLRETETADYPQRTEKNVLDSDGTLIISHGSPSGGTLLTVRIAKRHEKPLLIVDLDEFLDDNVEQIRHAVRKWLTTNSVATLNVAGPRENQSPGIHRESHDLLAQLFSG